MSRIILKSVLAVALLHSVMALASSSMFPSITELQQQLHLWPGAELPKSILYHGRVFQPYYVRAEQRKRGEYAIIVRLR